MKSVYVCDENDQALAVRIQNLLNQNGFHAEARIYEGPDNFGTLIVQVRNWQVFVPSSEFGLARELLIKQGELPPDPKNDVAKVIKEYERSNRHLFLFFLMVAILIICTYFIR